MDEKTVPHVCRPSTCVSEPQSGMGGIEEQRRQRSWRSVQAGTGSGVFMQLISVSGKRLDSPKPGKQAVIGLLYLHPTDRVLNWWCVSCTAQSQGPQYDWMFQACWICPAWQNKSVHSFCRTACCHHTDHTASCSEFPDRWLKSSSAYIKLLCRQEKQNKTTRCFDLAIWSPWWSRINLVAGWC